MSVLNWGFVKLWGRTSITKTPKLPQLSVEVVRINPSEFQSNTGAVKLALDLKLQSVSV